MTQFEFNSVKTQQQQSSHSLVPINSAEGNFSTSESIFSKNNTKNTLQGQSSNLDDHPIQPPLSLQPQELKQQHRIKPALQQQSNRLFTFMDEKESQRRLIYNLMNKHKMSHDQQTCAFFKGKQNVPIETMIQESRQKREQFLQKILSNKNKSHKQIKKSQRLNSKTPKNNYFLDTVISNLRNTSKTPKQEPHRSITPKYNRIVRVKSSLEKDIAKFGQSKRQLLPKAAKKTLIPKKQYSKSNIAIDYDQTKESNEQKSVKALIRQKRQLQKRLSQINESLLSCRTKVKTGKKNPIKTAARGNNGKRSKAKLLL